MLSIIAVLVVCITNIILGLIVLINNPKAKLNRVFAGFTFVLSAWSAIIFLEDYDPVLYLIEPLARLDYALAAVMLVLFYWFCHELTLVKRQYLLRMIQALALLSVMVSLWGRTVSVQFQQDDIILAPGTGYPLFIALLLLGFVGGISLLVFRYSKMRGIRRTQIKFIGFGLVFSASLLLLSAVILPRIFGFTDSAVTRIGTYGLLVFLGFSTYAIVKHRFLDVRLIATRSLAYLGLLVTLATLYALPAFQLSRILFKDGSGFSAAHEVYNIVLAIILALAFQPLRRFFERATDRIFYRDRYDTQAVLNNFGKILVTDFKLDHMLKRSLIRICQDLNIGFGQIIIFNKGQVYRIEHYGPLPERLIIAPKLKSLNKNIIVADELEGGERKRIMDEHGLRLSAMLRTSDETLGYLLLGDKLSGDIYSNQDIDVIRIMAKQLSVAVSNAKAYAEIQEFAETLQERVNQATGRLRVANHHLKELDKVKDEFISMASHQLRTPLTTIKGYLSMMLEGDAGKITKTQREFLEYAFGGSERMVQLISDLLNVSRLSAGRFIIDPRPTDVVAMVRDEVRQLQSHADNKKLQLIFIGPENELPLIDIDENKTRQVIMNFIDNAIYYTASGSVTVKLEVLRDKLHMEVQDTGIGVPKEAQKHLFTKFFRAENAQSVRPDGTGLGLYLARRVVEDQGGTILFNSTEGKGSMFGFELPLKKEPSHA